MRKTRSLALILCALTLTAACIHKTGGAVTPWERVHTYNASLAETNNAIEKGAEIAVSTDLLQPAQAAPVIGWTGQVATLHLQVTAILQQGQATTANIAGVRSLIDQIKASIATLPPAALGIKNPKSQQTFEQDVQAIGTLADGILAALEAIGTGSASRSIEAYPPPITNPATLTANPLPITNPATLTVPHSGGAK